LRKQPVGLLIRNCRNFPLALAFPTYASIENTDVIKQITYPFGNTVWSVIKNTGHLAYN